ncbi:hypothetical protein [Embleya sp. AB8]|uniref:hypothetical protein n=1 Tax=Embleya sp. AB8 TaxID=3156304 RepID=UPI003C71E784
MTAANPFGADFWSGNRGVAWLALLELLVLVVVLLRVLARRAGPRGLIRGFWQQVVATGRAFAAPFRAWRRDRRGVATLARHLGAPETFEVATRALAAARAAGGRPWAVVLAADRRSVSVRLAAAKAPEAAEPWSAAPGEPLTWSAAVGGLAAPEEYSALPVVVGLLGSDVVLLDLSAIPPVLAVTGDRAAGTDLGHALAAQLARRLPAGTVGVAGGVHPGFAGRPVGELCADPPVRVLVCAQPAPELEYEMAEFARRPDRWALVLGDVRGRRLALRPNTFGVLHEEDGLGPVETAGLARAVARVVRSGWPPEGTAGPAAGAGVRSAGTGASARSSEPANPAGNVPALGPGARHGSGTESNPAPGRVSGSATETRRGSETGSGAASALVSQAAAASGSASTSGSATGTGTGRDSGSVSGPASASASAAAAAEAGVPVSGRAGGSGSGGAADGSRVASGSSAAVPAPIPIPVAESGRRAPAGDPGTMSSPAGSPAATPASGARRPAAFASARRAQGPGEVPGEAGPAGPGDPAETTPSGPSRP